MSIYVASSWRNNIQQQIVAQLRAVGFDVYDFKNPKPGDKGFHWSEIAEAWKSWTTPQFREALTHPIAEAGFKSDMDALKACNACLLVLPCGRSAHLELGWAVGAGKKTVVLSTQHPEEPELMYKMVGLVTDSVEEAVTFLKTP
jgi:hypothetical protein